MESSSKQAVLAAAQKAIEMKPSTILSGTRKTCHLLHADLIKIRQSYRHLIEGKTPFSRSDEWLFDNYYIFEREGRQTLRALREVGRLPCDHTRLPLVYHYAKIFCEAMENCIGVETITLFLDTLHQHDLLESIELNSFPLFLRVVFIHNTAMAYLLPSNEQENPVIANTVRSLNLLSTLDFSEIVEKESPIEKELSCDPAGIYPKMEERSRAYYRERLATIAKKQGISEKDAAKKAVMLAKKGTSPRTRHVGHYILDQALERPFKSGRGKLYLFCLWFLPLVLSVGLSVFIHAPWSIVLFYLPIWEILRPILEYFFLKNVPVTFIPRLELHDTIPEEAGTLATISTLLTSPQQASTYAHKLEQAYMANGRGNILFGLLVDLKEATLPHRPEDESIINAAIESIAQLNQKHGLHFCLFLRSRQFCATQNNFSGYERKRGAILELVRFIKGKSSSIKTIKGDLTRIHKVKYLIALDADTTLIMDTATEMVSAAMHPLNQPEIDKKRGIVRKGFGILSPRIGVDLESAGATMFSRIMAGCGGVTAYDNASGNLYQDLFGEGIFAGKGLINVEAFDTLSGGDLPENHVLSHDILEGCFLHAGFLSDVELTDSFPGDPKAWFLRLHRWIRGDWQNILFLKHYIPNNKGQLRPNPFGGLSHFKLLDNLRRSLTPLFSFACLIVAAFSPFPLSIALFTVALLSIIGPALWNMLLTVLSGGPSMLSRKYHCKARPQAIGTLLQGGIGYLFLPVHAFTALHAICTALWRLHSKKGLLTWTTSAETENHHTRLSSFWFTALFGILLCIFAFSVHMKIASAFFIITPFIAWLSGKKEDAKNQPLTGEEKNTLYSYMAAMWRYYDEFMGKDDHFLPPDNVQEAPAHKIAHRTSPTNIGLGMLSLLAARDFKLIDSETLRTRTEQMLNTIERLQKWKGHLLNWYNTRTLEPLHPAYISTVDSGNFLCCLTAFYEGLHDYAHEAAFTPLCERIKKLLDNTDMAILYNRRRKLFHLGYDLEKNEFSEIYYDLLMSEARLASYYAIAKKIVPKRHWGTLGRTLVKQNGYTGPVSWTGTMFEYLMPHLLLPVYKDSFTAEAIRFVLYCQKKRVQSHHVPWGISESGFYAFDAALNYQYEAHGVQKMALKRGMNGDLVISPYSTFLALPFDRTASLKNLHALKEYGLLGHCGFFEAIDFTSTRTNGRRAIIKSYMAHHVGMSIVACANASFDNIMQKRFMRNEQMRAANDLLKEKIPANAIVFKDIEKREIPQKPGNRTFTKESFEETSPVTPRAHVIANNDYTMVLTDCGASFSVFHGLDLTKRSHDLLRRPTGIFALAKAQGQILSATYAPFYTADPAYKQQTTFLTDGAIYRTNAENWGISMHACLHGNLPCEARQFEISNDTNRSLETNLLIYLEPLLSKTADEEAHPAFSRLFLQATYQADTRILLFTRRLRENESPIFLAIGFSKVAQPFHFELDRTALLERPQGISSLKNAFSVPFTDKTGAVPDIAAAMQLSLSVPAHKKESLTLLLAAGTTEKEAISSLLEARLEGFHNILRNAAGKNGNGIEARLSSLILPQILFPVGKNLLRSSAKKQNHMGQSGLWSLGISGDLPIIVFPFENTAGTERLEAYIRTHRTLKLDGILCDLVIIFHESGDYARSHTDNLHSILKNCGSDHLLDTSGGIHLVNLNFHSDTIRLLLFSCACHIASPENKSSFSPYIAAPLQNSNPVEKESPDFSFYAGGFTEKGVVIPHQEENPPAPWCHILAHQTFGTLVSDRALGFTWATNAHENKLTPWFNDPVYDNQGELLLLRLGGQIYNLCANAQVTFSNDRAIYKSQINGLLCTVTVCVPQNLLAKTVTLAIENRSKQAVQWEVAYYTEPVLGSSLSLRRHLALTCKDKAIFFKNAWAPVTGIGFLSTKQKSAILTNRAAFFSGNWIEEQTDSLDPCAALIQSGILVAEGTHTSIFALGWCASENAAFKMSQMALASAQNDPKSFMPLKQKRISVPVHAQMETATLPISQDNSYMMNYLPHSSDEIRIETPSASLNWLMRSLRHQFLGSRIFGRTGFYQCGGAWGFRDQLQDCTAALLLDPQITRAHILRCCAHQFDGGDVMHWWHQLPKKDGGTKGVRTRISDDLLWLPLVVADYLEKTDDTTLLHVPIAYLDGPQLKPGEKDHYFAPTPSDKIETVYQHCVQAIERATTHGAHGLPLFGAGDWNDGMNLVGAAGKGESVWLAMFLIYVLEQFSPICRKMHEDSRAEAYKQKAFSLRETVDAHCWDGNWYLRGFYDDGTPLGGKACDDCQIDILPQAFSSIAGFPDPNRRKVALDSMLQILADDRLRILKLFSPPFDHGTHNPGYIRAYPPGIRENGGQYTHAAVWGALGLLMDGRSDDAWRILQWINPIERSLQNKQAQQYRLEPYAIAGDISSNPTIEGRGGWSLYTGAAAWYYRVVLEYMLGIHIHAHNLNLRPLLPSDWDGYTAQLNLRGSKIDLRVQKGMDKGLTVDGQKMQTIPLDGNTHQVQFIF